MENMMQNMMKRYPLIIGMGFMIVVLSVVIGTVNAANAAGYYAVDKATRDASLELAQVRAPFSAIQSRRSTPRRQAQRSWAAWPAYIQPRHGWKR